MTEEAVFYPGFNREKLVQNKIARQSKPFVDHNLQLQIPGSDAPPSQIVERPHNPIYAHFSPSSPAAELSLQINQDEFYQAMQEAERSYQSWQQMQQELKKLIHACKSRLQV